MEYDFTQELQKIETVLEKALPDDAGVPWCQQQFGTISPAVTPQHIAPLLTPCTRLMHLGGKRWRPLLQILCAQAMAGTDTPPEVAYQLTPLVEFVHTASLIHDDIEDAADTRRGAPAAHITYGLDTALNAGAWLYFVAPSCIQSSGLDLETQLLLNQLYHQELRRLHLGQAMDIAWHRNNETIPSQEEYTAMVRMKTGTLASLAAQVGIIAGGGNISQAQEVGRIASDIGIGFQVLDDVINLTSGNVGKKRGDDIVEGKKSLPILLHLEKNPQDLEELTDFFARARIQGVDSPAVEQAISMVTDSGAIEEAATLARTLIQSAGNWVEELFPNNVAAKKISWLFNNMLKVTIG
ncbi:MAG: polyprenyl synthetase family protein [Spirochaetaceae bacterium]|nr:polyprenyl synthetase family protein [Spirochaetaceae bacterium]